MQSDSGFLSDGSDGSSSAEFGQRPKLATRARAFIVSAAVFGVVATFTVTQLRRPGNGDVPMRSSVNAFGMEQKHSFHMPPLGTIEALHPYGMPSLGTVEAMYTFGAPATAKTPLKNLLRKDGCFGGLRSYTEDVVGPVTKQVDAAAISNPYPHAKIDTVVLRKGRNSIYVRCGATSWPNDNAGDVFSNWGLHWENDYTPRLKKVKVHGKDVHGQEPFLSAYNFVLLAYKSYDSTLHTRQAIAERIPGWKLVARETRVSGSGTLYDEDPVMIVQSNTTLDCALTFTGTNNGDNEVYSSTNSYTTGYCGFNNVHVGYRNELWDVTKDLWPRLRPKLSKCNKVYCVGHSLGGSLCEIFAACANSKRIDDPDYQQQMWTREDSPEMMEEIKVGKVKFVDGGEKRCKEPPCPK